ncbi:LCP family protein [Caldanaerobacter subterraneus]|uniref:Transcriptional regulator n=2 Tax=Caldanaerobacter subterraneus TaxID=911092 RepID=U5CTQ8_CALSX|nr:LCP family protein [Caldanaerobacter subterraneus]ERM91492.1 transcriptional regulator [Caldanaerobacter subterraneus subsp. yonseiensis KB-1]NNG67620.1 LCP family protein [Caldanaerobacter subterraneus]
MKKIVKILTVIFLGIILSVGIGAYIFYKNIHVPAVQEENPIASLNNPEKKEEDLSSKNVLVVGSDENNLSDTLFIANYNPKNKTISILSIPRDTYYPRPGYNSPGDKKINAAFTEDGIEGTKKAVENLLGINIDHHIIIDYEGFKKVIDTIGGVEVDIPFDMKYDDNSANPPLHINLKKGRQVLDGEKAIQFVRYRHGYIDGDLGRIKAQHQFLEALFKKLIQPSTLPKLPSLAIAVSKHIKTDLTATEIAQYAYQFVKDKPSSIKSFTLPGEPDYKDGVSYFFADNTKIPEVVAEFLGDKTTFSFDPSEIEKNKAIKVEVLNGTNIPGLASKHAETLRKQGFDVVRIGNVVGTTFSTSHVYARTDEEKAKKVANALSIICVEKDITPDSSVDVTVILGKDKSK